MLLENLLTIEDINGMMMVDSSFSKLYEIDCNLLPQSDFNETYYDFNIVRMFQETSGDFEGKYHYVVKVFNKLWDGKVSFKDIPANADEPIVFTDPSRNYNGELYILHVLADYTTFKILLNLDNLSDGERQSIDLPIDSQAIFPSTFDVQLSSKNISYIYYETKNVTFSVKDANGVGVENASIIIKSSLGETHAVTDAEGNYVFRLPNTMPNTYEFYVTVSKNGFLNYNTSFVANIKKETPTINLNQNQGFWGGYVTDTVNVSTNGNVVNSLKIRIQDSKNKLNTDKTVTVAKRNNVFSYAYEQSYRTLRINSVNIKVTVNATNYTNKVEKTFSKSLVPKTITTWDNVKTECANPKGVDYIRLTSANISVNNYATISRDMEIVADSVSNNWSILQNSNNYVFSIKAPSTKRVTLKLENIRFHQNKGVIYCHPYVNVKVTNCYFTHNLAKGDIGACIKTKVGEEYLKKNYGKLDLVNCFFYNNKGSTIATSMDTNINHAKIILNDWDYAQHPQCYGIEVYGQDTTVRNTDFICDMGNVQSTLPIRKHSNFSHGKCALRIHKKAKLNNKKGEDMVGDSKASLIAYNNTSYLYAKYKYDGVDVVASATNGNERKAYGHVINGIDWAYKNHISVSTVHNNRNRKPAITLPKDANENRRLTA